MSRHEVVRKILVGPGVAWVVYVLTWVVVARFFDTPGARALRLPVALALAVPAILLADWLTTQGRKNDHESR